MSSEAPQCIPFIVNERPYAFWDWDPIERNLEFIEGIDPGHFEFVASIHAGHLDGDDKHRAATSLRTSYAQALETLFALLCAMAQAPQCVVGWLLKYRNEDLRVLVDELLRGGKFPSRLSVAPSVASLSQIVHGYIPASPEKAAWIAEGFADAWSTFADEFLDDGFQKEYNSIKHGLRVRPGGVWVSAGIERIAGEPAHPDDMECIGGSIFGTTYHELEQLDGAKGINLRSRTRSQNWVPTNLVLGLRLASWSVSNVLSALRIMNGRRPDECRFLNPSSPDAFTAPWKIGTGITACSFNSILESSQITPMTKAEVLRSYAEDPSRE